MNTRAWFVRAIGMLLVGVSGFPCISRALADIIILGEKGEVLLYSPSGATGTLTRVVQSIPTERPISDSHFVPAEQKLFVSGDGRLYELDLRATSNGYQRIDTGEDLVSCAVWYDAKERRPAWLHVMNKASPARVRFRGEDNVLREGQNGDIEFPRGFVFGMHIDGWKTSGALAEMSPDLAVLPARYPDDQWIIVGRSREIAAYIRKPAIPVKTGQPVTATILFQHRVRSRWSLEAMDEYCQVSVYADVAVLRGLYDIKGDKDPATGNDVQAKPSGKWYFYEPSQARVTAYDLDPLLTVQYATASEAIVSGNGQLLMLRLGEPDRAKPELLAELPPGFSVVTVCPL